MKIILKRVLCCILTISLTLGLAEIAGHILDPKWAEDGFDVIEAFEKLEKDSMEVIVFGSSHAWKGCDTRVMADDYGIIAYNYSCNWQSINTTMLFLKDSLRTQTPKVVCIDAGLVNNIEKDVDLNGQIYYTKKMKNFDGKREYLKQCFGDDLGRYISYYMPIVMFHENWTEIDDENFRFPGPERYWNTRGYQPGTKIYPCVKPDYKNFRQDPIQEDCIAVLDEILAVCKEKNVQVLFYTCPWEGEYYYSDAMKEYVKDKECAFLDLFEYSDEIGINWATDFRDYGHLNNSGAKKVADFLSAYLIENYEITHK